MAEEIKKQLTTMWEKGGQSSIILSLSPNNSVTK